MLAPLLSKKDNIKLKLMTLDYEADLAYQRSCGRSWRYNIGGPAICTVNYADDLCYWLQISPANWI